MNKADKELTEMYNRIIKIINNNLYNNLLKEFEEEYNPYKICEECGYYVHKEKQSRRFDGEFDVDKEIGVEYCDECIKMFTDIRYMYVYRPEPLIREYHRRILNHEIVDEYKEGQIVNMIVEDKNSEREKHIYLIDSTEYYFKKDREDYKTIIHL